MMAARQCCPVTTGGRDRFDILTLSLFCPLQQTRQEKERGITAETGKCSLPLPPYPLLFSHLSLFSLTYLAHKHMRTADNTECNSLVCCHIQPLNSQMTSFWRQHNSIQCLSICSGSGNMLSEEIFIHSAAVQLHKSPRPT